MSSSFEVRVRSEKKLSLQKSAGKGIYCIFSRFWIKNNTEIMYYYTYLSMAITCRCIRPEAVCSNVSRSFTNAYCEAKWDRPTALPLNAENHINKIKNKNYNRRRRAPKSALEKPVKKITLQFEFQKFFYQGPMTSFRSSKYPKQPRE